MPNDDGRSFNLTVKIYPGGPPQTRGTSAFLGSVPVGTPVAVPQVRSARWAIWPPSQAKRVGLIAFGVGIAEVLDPLQTLLAESMAEVRLLYASRSRHAILYRHRLQRLLTAHPRRLTVRHCVSRSGRSYSHEADAREDGQDEAQSLAAGERVSFGRISAAIVREEFGRWAEEGTASDEAEHAPHFLVVGTRRMEHTAWEWLQTLDLGRRPLLLGAPWQPLIRPPQHLDLGTCPARGATRRET
jgi:ferredoxin-NADP reductase